MATSGDILGESTPSWRPRIFFYTIWFRIRPLGSKVREAQGERF